MPLREILDELSVDKAWSHIEHITERIPSRLAGSENSRRMAEYAQETFEGYGLSSRLSEFQGLVSFPESVEVRVLSAHERTVEANTLGHSASTNGIVGELVYVGSGAETEYEGKDVRGKITLSELSYSPARHEKAYIAWKRGSIAQIMMNWGHDANEAVPYGSMKSAWGNPSPDTLETEMPDLPCVGIARSEGLRLKDESLAGAVRVWVRAQVENSWKPLTMTTAEFNAQRDRQFMLLGGHMDSWFGPQATDNAAGNACIMELARVFAQHRDELKRGIAAGLWMGHETGTMISSTRFADTNWDRLRRSCIAYMQIDQPAIAGSSTWHLDSTDDIQAYATQSAREVIGDMPIHWKRQHKNGDASFFGVGLPCVAGAMSFTDEEIQATALARLGWWHHSVHNTIDKVDKDRLALHLRVYAHWIWGLLTDPVLPYQYEPLATRFVDRLSELAKLNVPDIDMQEAVELAKQFQLRARDLDAQSRFWSERQTPADGDLDHAAGILNHAMIQVSRILVPIASTVVGPYGQDRYGHVWQTQMIPSMAAFPTLAAFDSDSEEFQVWWVAMVRARNRVVDAIDNADRIVKVAIGGLT